VSPSVLLVDDDEQILVALGRYFERAGYEVVSETTGSAALSAYDASRPEVVLLDLRLPDASEFSVLEAFRERDASVILLTGHGDVETAVEAMRLGAEDFLTKPVDLGHLAAVVNRISEKTRILRENERLRRSWLGSGGIEALGVSEQMQEVARRARLVAASDRTAVLLTGERGTGKGWLARMIHELSPRSSATFLEVNASAHNPDALATELFGQERRMEGDTFLHRDGLLHYADGGTLFLDEVAGVGLELQIGLLRVLEGRSLRRVGGDREMPVNVRFIAATDTDLRRAVEQGSFREELHYALNVAPIHLPPLRERSKEDLSSLLDAILATLALEIPGGARRFTDEARALLVDYEWPGNIREMRNVLERSLIFGKDAELLTPDHLPNEVRHLRVSRSRVRDTFRPESLEEVERRHIRQMLAYHDGNRTHAARDLGIARSTLIQKIQRYGIEG